MFHAIEHRTKSMSTTARYPPKVYHSVNYATRCASLSLSRNQNVQRIEFFRTNLTLISKISLRVFHRHTTDVHSQSQLIRLKFFFNINSKIKNETVSERKKNSVGIFYVCRDAVTKSAKKSEKKTKANVKRQMKFGVITKKLRLARLSYVALLFQFVHTLH